jgi:hypothetical protein
MASKEEFMFLNVAYRPTVYRTVRIILPNSRRIQMFAVFEANCTVGQLYEFTVPDAPVIYWLQSGSPLDGEEHSIFSPEYGKYFLSFPQKTI